MKYAILGAVVAIAIAVPLFAPSVWERIHRNTAPTTTAKPKPVQPARAVAARTHSHRLGA